jgi:hypothetical protein
MNAAIASAEYARAERTLWTAGSTLRKDLVSRRFEQSNINVGHQRSNLLASVSDSVIDIPRGHNLAEVLRRFSDRP